MSNKIRKLNLIKIIQNKLINNLKQLETIKEVKEEIIIIEKPKKKRGRPRKTI
jgi:hypothetical protein